MKKVIIRLSEAAFSRGFQKKWTCRVFESMFVVSLVAAIWNPAHLMLAVGFATVLQLTEEKNRK